MLLNEHTTYVESKLFSKIPHITHGFSCKGAGDMRDFQTLVKFQRSLGISESFFQPRQVHGSTVVVNPKHTATVKADGILLFKEFSKVESVGVLTADCVPVLFTDIHGNCIGAVHSGWKGTLQNIVSMMISHMLSEGVDIQEIRVCIGPHIGSCCYTVGVDRIHLFEQKYKDISLYSYELNGVWHLDLGRLILKQLEQTGLHRHQIETGIYCTSCQIDSFFSYRRDSKERFGEMIAVLGFT